MKDAWRIEAEQTDRFIRSREYRLAGPRSLSWAKTDVPRDGYEVTLAKTREVKPWPEHRTTLEVDIPPPPTGADETFNYYRAIRLSRDLPDFPGYYDPPHYVFDLIDGGRKPKRVRFQFEQSAYRATCEVTVLEWGEVEPELEDYRAEPSRTSVALVGLSVKDLPERFLRDADRRLQIDGLSLGMSSEKVLNLWSSLNPQPRVSYRQDNGEVILLSGHSLRVGGTVLDRATSLAEIETVLSEFDFKRKPFPFPEAEDPEVAERFSEFRSNFALFESPGAYLMVQDNDPESGRYALTGVFSPYGSDFPQIDWLGPPPTIHGISLTISEQEALHTLGRPARTLEDQTFCYCSHDCRETPDSPVALHLTFNNKVIDAIYGDQLEQDGTGLLDSRFKMPPEHSTELVQQVVSWDTLGFKRSASGENGPVEVVYSEDLNLEVWVYPNGKRQFVLRDIDLPRTIVNLTYP